MDTREKIIKTALQLFLQLGYDKTSMNQIAKKIGITKAAIYYYFSGKEILFQNVYTYFAAQMSTWMKSRVEDSRTARDFIQTFFASVKPIKEFEQKILDNDRIQSIYSFDELIHSASKKDPSIRVKMRESYIEARKRIGYALLAGQKRGEINNNIDCNILSFIILALIEGTIVISSWDDTIDITKISEQMFDNFWEIISH